MSRRPALPTLDFLRGFDAAARHLSFTRAAEEMFLTQSALSRQIKTLEDEIGVALFERGHRELKLTPAGETLRRTAHAVLAEVAQAVTSMRSRGDTQRVTVSTTAPFASLWLIPRLSRFREAHPGAEVFVSADSRMVDLDRGEVDVAIRYTADDRAPAQAMRLFGERMFPVASPRLRKSLRRPQDLSRQVLLHLEDPKGRLPWVDWSLWLAASGLQELQPAGNLRFSQYDLLLQAAMDDQGVALGRSPLVDHWLAAGKLIAPFPNRYQAPRSYFVLRGSHAAERPEVEAFVAWVVAEASSVATKDA
jgi:DNA-binding transcriptional LysR family regulator